MAQWWAAPCGCRGQAWKATRRIEISEPVYCEAHRGAGLLTVVFILYGPIAEQAPAIENRWRQMLEEQFGGVN